MSGSSLRIGIAGLGTVGAGTVDLLNRNADLIEKRCGRKVEVTAVCARNKSRDRGIDLSAFTWHDDPMALAADENVDVVVELIGGEDGPAKALVEASLKASKPVVTANKALIAHHGFALAKLAEEKQVALAFEAAVAGGIPILHALRTGLAANQVERLEGILNGTCNYILTRMRGEGKDFDEVLGDAQKLGYAEADPSFDVDGVDAAHKLAILTSLVYGTPVNFDAVHVEGIRSITASDMRYAEEMGYVIKLLGVATKNGHGVEQRVHPCMVDAEKPIAKVSGAFNAVVVQGDAVGTVVFEGAGAGAGPTASAVVADIIDVARGSAAAPFNRLTSEMEQTDYAPMAAHESCFYIRLNVVDKPGVLASVTGIFRDHSVSMRSFVQHSRQPGEIVELALTTHEAKESAMQAALDAIAALDAVVEKPQRIRIES